MRSMKSRLPHQTSQPLHSPKAFQLSSLSLHSLHANIAPAHLSLLAPRISCEAHPPPLSQPIAYPPQRLCTPRPHLRGPLARTRHCTRSCCPTQQQPASRADRERTPTDETAISHHFSHGLGREDVQLAQCGVRAPSVRHRLQNVDIQFFIVESPARCVRPRIHVQREIGRDRRTAEG